MKKNLATQQFPADLSNQKDATIIVHESCPLSRGNRDGFDIHVFIG
jgi:hypothetical protein